MPTTAKKTTKVVKKINIVRKGGKLTPEEKARRNKMKIRLFDLLVEARRLNLLEDPRCEEIGGHMIDFGFVEGAEDALYNNQSGPWGKSFGVWFDLPRIIDKSRIVRGEHDRVILNIESSENTWEHVVDLFKAQEIVILAEQEERKKKEAVKNKAKELLTATERTMLGLHF